MVYRGVKVVSDIDIVKIAAKGIGLKLSLLVFIVDIEISVAVCINIGGFVKQQSLGRKYLKRSDHSVLLSH